MCLQYLKLLLISKVQLCFCADSLRETGRRKDRKFCKTIRLGLDGIICNQLSNGANIGLLGYESTYQDLQSKMQLIYRENQKLNYRQKPVVIVLINLETGIVTSQYTLPATLVESKRNGAASAY